MIKKRVLIIITIALILTGCTRLSDDLGQIVDETMKYDNIKVNRVSTGYELYIPTGVQQISDKDYNQEFKIRDRYVYLYVDIVSYYYNYVLNYDVINSYDYFYKKINFNDKTGYIGVNRENDLLFVEIVYNYSKIEFYCEEKDLSYMVANSLVILNSIKYNDELIKIGLNSINSDSGEIKYELDKPKDTESTFSKYLQEYIAVQDEEVELPDDD